MLPIHARIDRAQRLLQMLEDDAPLLAIRVAQLTPERQQSAKQYAAALAACARVQLERLREQCADWDANDPTPQAAD
jgi:hypothetical protein